MPVGAPLDNLAFSTCGNHLHGIVCGPVRGQLRLINIREYFEERKALTSSGQEHDTKAQKDCQNEQLPLTRATKAGGILPTESIAFDNVEGRSQISMLRHLNDEGTVILQKF
ncbi:hypothetical protein HD806DRAFT_503682 [Xylariaceae sp. AK1471]|nr:hypothetical protein HD806DRAFT_503682 [Xylariaceae sp. AK1471]